MKIEKVIITENLDGKEIVNRAGDKNVELCVKGLNSSNKYKNRYEAVYGDIREITDAGIKFFIHYCEFSKKIHFQNVLIPFENLR